MGETVVLVHGLWISRFIMDCLERRLRRCGFHTAKFYYPSVGNDISANARLLYQCSQRLQAETVHFIGYSLGGLVVLRLFQDFPAQRPGRIVLLGTPYGGSYVARRLAKYGFWRRLFGESLDQGLLGPAVAWGGGRDLGVIAGTLPVGGGVMWVPSLPRPHDGTVALRETHVPGMTEHITLPVAHTGLVFSRAVAEQVCHFLNNGRFAVRR